MKKNNYVFIQIFTEYVQGVFKGSMNRTLMFMFGTTACVCAVMALTIIMRGGKDVIVEVIGLIGALVSPIFVLGGFSMTSKNVDIKNTIANPNLLPPTPQV